MTKHIGIVACSAEGAALCYTTICLEGSALLGRHAHPEVSMHNHCLAQYMEFVYRDEWQGVADLMLSSAAKLASGGADFLICPDNTIHQAFDLVLPRSPLPWLHIAEEVAAEAARHEYKRLAVLGTQFLMEGPVYREKLGAAGMEAIIPRIDERQRINDIIFNELVYGRFPAESQKYFLDVITRMKVQDGCDAAVLGCTEIPLIVRPEESALPVLDSTRLLARAALRRALHGAAAAHNHRFMAESTQL